MTGIEPALAVSNGINLTRLSLDRADHNEGRCNVLGLGFDS